MGGKNPDGLLNLDELHRTGVTFSNAFVTMSLCSPSRATMLTGMYAHRHQVIDNENNDPDWQKHPNFGMLLQQNGYATAFVGKLHGAPLSGPQGVRPGFDYWLGFKGQGQYFDPLLNENGQEQVAKGYITDILTDRALGWLREGRDKRKPFSLCLWHKAIHENFSPAPRHAELYQGEKLAPPPYDTHLDTFEGKPTWQKKRATYPYSPDNPRWLKMLRTLKAVDESVGRVVEELKQQGLYENTVIIFTSDNGYFMGDHRFGDKRLAYEPSMRVPLLISWPAKIRAQAGREVEQMALNIDFAPTILEMAAVAVPQHMQGRSLLPLLGDDNVPPADWRTSFLFENFRDRQYPQAAPNYVAVRTERYKYVLNDTPDDIQEELYDLQEDPGELKNQASNPHYTNVLQRLRQELKRLRHHEPRL
jgi:N-acetylglucosamine-6-sulfatase